MIYWQLQAKRELRWVGPEENPNCNCNLSIIIIIVLCDNQTERGGGGVARMECRLHYYSRRSNKCNFIVSDGRPSVRAAPTKSDNFMFVLNTPLSTHDKNLSVLFSDETKRKEFPWASNWFEISFLHSTSIVFCLISIHRPRDCLVLIATKLNANTTIAHKHMHVDELASCRRRRRPTSTRFSF